jgi:hypothetical protein
MELYLHSPATPSWCGAEVSNAQDQLHLYRYLILAVAHVTKAETHISKQLLEILWPQIFKIILNFTDVSLVLSLISLHPVTPIPAVSVITTLHYHGREESDAV